MADPMSYRIMFECGDSKVELEYDSEKEMEQSLYQICQATTMMSMSSIIRTMLDLAETKGKLHRT